MNDQKQILIAEDDRDLLELLGTRCKHLGLDVIEASGALDALSMADFCPPDIALLDVRMPGGNGISVAEMMATDDRLSSTAVIVMTGDPNEMIQQRCHEMGAQLVMKDQMIWTRLEPMLRELIDGDHESTARPLEAFSDVKPNADSRREESVVSLLADWGWMDETEARLDEQDSDDCETPWVLAIDDDPDFSLGLQKRLLNVGVQLVRAYRGMDGYRCAFRGRPAAILLDYKMPDGNGEYILRRLKESPATECVPVIVITGMADAPLKRRMLAGGANEFLPKPVTWERLARTLTLYTDLDLRSKSADDVVCMA